MRGIAGIICAAAWMAGLPGRPEEVKAPPLVRSAELPVHPTEGIGRFLEGRVVLRVRTDGERAAEVEAVELAGNPCFRELAMANVRTWRFEPHAPTGFTPVFTYRLEGTSRRRGNPLVILALPEKVTLVQKRILECDGPGT